jgi:putative FmdB family regulatory protein
MPLYEYECNSCEARADYCSAIATRDAPRICPMCGGTMHRVLAPIAGFKFRAPGWKPYTPEAAAGSESAKEELCYAADAEGNVL